MGWGIVYPPYSVINMGVVQPPTPTTRWVYNFNGVNSYIGASIQASSGDVVRFKIRASGSGSGGRVMLSGGPTAGNHVYFVGTKVYMDGGRFTVKIDGQEVVSGVTEIPMDGAIYQFEAISTGNYSINAIGSNTSQFYCDFPIFDVVVNDGSVYNYPINDRTFGAGAPIANSATVLGAELFVNPTIGSYWTDNGDGSYTINAPDGAFNSLSVLPAGLVNGDTILIQFEVVSISGADSVSAHVSGQQVRSDGNIGTFKGLVAYGGGTLQFARRSGSGAFTSTIINISIKKANGYATGVNLLESGWTEINL